MKLLDPHFRRALVFVRPYMGALVPVVLLSLAGTALNLVLPYLSKGLVDDALIGPFRTCRKGSSTMR